MERWHRELGESLKCSFTADGFIASHDVFTIAVKKAARIHNTSVSSRKGSSPHAKIFNFDSWMYPSLKALRPQEVPNEPLPSVLESTDNSKINSNSKHNLIPEVGEIWLYRITKTKKLQRPYIPCRVLKVVSRHVYDIQTAKDRKRVHLRYLKKLSKELAEELSVELPPEDARPLRNKRIIN